MKKNASGEMTFWIGPSSKETIKVDTMDMTTGSTNLNIHDVSTNIDTVAKTNAFFDKINTTIDNISECFL